MSDHVVVIGAGVAGLAAARMLQRAGLRVTVLERAERVGGRIRTEHAEGVALDVGAVFFANFYYRTMALIGELDLADQLRPIPGLAAILRAGELHPIWSSPRVVLTRLISLGSKLALLRVLADVLCHRALLDLHAFHTAHPLDTEPVSDYARRVLGEDALEYLIEPLLSGIFYWTPEHTSRAMLFVLLMAGLYPGGMRLSALHAGMDQLPRALARGLDVRLGVEVCRVERAPDRGYTLQTLQAGQPAAYEAAAVVCATPATAVGQIFPQLSAERRAFFGAVRYSASAAVALGLDRRLPPELYGLMLPRRESGVLAAAMVQSARLPEALPPGRDVLQLHSAGPVSAALLRNDDPTICAVLLAELRRTIPAYAPAGAGQFARVYRWPEALPEFDVGHFQRLQRFAEGQIEEPGLVYAGDYLGGPFIEGAIVSGEQAAGRLLRALGR